jgi:phosphatidylglycerophosphatase C
MGDMGEDRQPEAPFRPLVAFDFDGTLTWKDSFLAFLVWRAGPGGYAVGLAALAPAVAAFAVNRDRGRLKAAAARRFLAGATRAELEADAQRFATELGRPLLRPDAVRAWRRWQGDGARLVIVTASPDTLVAPIARALGADLLIGTRLAFDADDRATGALDGANCRGPEKVRRLREVFGEDVRLEAAYGDTDGDREMLALAEEQGLRVFNGKGGRANR